MKSILLPAALAIALAFTGSSAALAAESHGHHGHGEVKLQLDQGRKWATDAPLRQGMGVIRAALAQNHDAIHKGRLSAAQYEVLGATVEHHVGRIVAECKLPPEADANLHVVVAELVAAADAMQGRSAEKPAKGAERAVKALGQYARHFDHPGFKRIG
jgi:hypothetical protein